MDAGMTNPLLEGDLESAAFLCLAAAATTDLTHRFPPGSGGQTRREHHNRKRRFEQARQRVKEGATTLLALGLSPEDCSWAASVADRAKDPEGWRSRFHVAENGLRESHESAV